MNLLKYFMAFIMPYRLMMAEDGGGGGDLPSTDPRTYMDDKGNLTAGWTKAAMGEKNAGFEGKFTTLGGLLGSYGNMEKSFSSSSRVEVPTEHSSAEDWAAYWDKGGRPATAEEYQMNLPAALTDSVFDADAVTEFKGKAHKLGLTAAQVVGITDWYGPKFGDLLTGEASKRQDLMDAGVTALKKEWGEDYDAKVQSAEAGAAALGMTADDLKGNPDMASNPGFIRAMARAAELVSEKPATAMRQMGEKLGVNSPEDARAKIVSIRNDPKHPYNGSSGATAAAHDRAVKEMSVLYNIANPEE